MSTNSLVFRRPVGAAADLAELEYISALHQTSAEIRRDGTIDARDVSLFLSSRYGIKLSEADVRDVIFSNGLSCGVGQNVDHAVQNAHNDHGDNGGNSAKNKESSLLCDSSSKNASDVVVEIAPLTTGTPRLARRSDFLDLAELAAALLIPELIRATKSDVEGGDYLNPLGAERPRSDFDSDGEYESYLERRRRLHEEIKSPEGIIGEVLDTLMEATFGAGRTSSTERAGGEGEGPRNEINEGTVKAILRAVGEHEIADNHPELVRGMVEAAKPPSADVMAGPERVGKRLPGGPAYLDHKSFARALISDLEKYRLDDDVTRHTNFRDVFGHDKTDTGCCGIGRCCADKERGVSVTADPCNGEVGRGEDLEGTKNEEMRNEEDAAKSEQHDEYPFADEEDKPSRSPLLDKTIFTAPSIDFTADTYSSRTIALGLWIFFLLHILASGTMDLQDFPSIVPTQLEVCPPTPHVGCDIAETMLSWVDRIFTLTVMGGIFIVCFGSVGNKIGESSRILVLASLLPPLYYLIKPFTSIGTSPSALKGEPHRQFALGTSMFVAGIIIAERLRQYGYLFSLKKLINRNTKLGRFFSNGFLGSEVERKEAASHKMNQVLASASGIAQEAASDRASRSCALDETLASFFEKLQASERAGGYFWTWRAMRSRDLYRKEGVLFSTRLVAANVMQFAIIIYIILFVMVTMGRWLDKFEDSSLVILINQGRSMANKLMDRMNSYEFACRDLTKNVFDFAYNTVFPTLHSFQRDHCQTLNEMANYTELQAVCSGESSAGLDSDTIESFCSKPAEVLQGMYDLCSNSTSYLDILNQNAESAKVLVELTFCNVTDDFVNSTKNFLGSAFDIMSTAVVIVDPFEAWMIQMALGMGGLVAFFSAIYLATLYMPSVASTTLKFRSGVIPSLRDPLFSKTYRKGTYLVTYLTGNLFWGALVYCAGIAFVIAIVILILCFIFRVMPELAGDPPTAPGFWGWLLGFIFTFALQWVLFASCGCAAYSAAYYRKKPAYGNIYSVLWEASWMGTSVMFVATRTLKLIVAAALHVGRIDVPFLADGSGEVLGLMHLDRMPMVFRTDILLHEAHRHPYIERLGKMYLMKLRHGNAFANAAGTSRRVVFVLTLMPWLRQYRYMARYGPEWKAEIIQANLRNEIKEDETPGLQADVFNTEAEAAEATVSDLRDEIARIKREISLLEDRQDIKGSE